MIDHEPVTLRLKALRERAGISVRKMAERVGMPSSSYSHYENPERFKAPFLPMREALLFADALEKVGVPRPAVLALAGSGQASEALSTATIGFAESAAEMWVPNKNRPTVSLQAIVQAVAPTTAAPVLYEMQRPVMSMGYLKGDILVVDLRRKPRPGDTVLAGIADETTSETLTFALRYFPPFVISTEPGDPNPVYRIDGGAQVGIRGIVTAMVRLEQEEV